MSKTHHITLTLWIVVGLVAIALSGPVDENEIKKGRECKTFCGSCGCIGFYCGEECICECNEENNDDTQCIASIQASAKEKRIPFEILIQGPSSNRFLKNALQFDQNQQQCSKGDSGRTKRSTVVIYKPAVENVLDPNGFCEKPVEKIEESKAKESFRGKRAIDVDSWFTDFSNTLVKPAPMPGMSKEEIEEVVEEPIEETSKESKEDDENLLPKIRGKLKNALNVADTVSIVKGIRKTVKEIENKALDGAAKKIRGAISTIRNKAEDILLPSAEVSDPGDSKSTGRKILNKLRDRIFRPFGEEQDEETIS